MAKKDAAAKTGMVNPEEHEKRPTSTATEQPAEKTRRKALTKVQRREAWEAAGGKCFVFGTDVNPFSSFGVEGERIFSEEAKRLKGDLDVEGLRDKLADALAKAGEAVKSTKAMHDLAVANEALYRKTFAALISEGDAIIFAGEAATAPAKSADEKGAG